MDMVSCCRLLAVRSFVLEVQSWSSNNVPINLYRINVVLRPDGKKQSPKAQLSPSKVPVLPKRRQSSAGSSFRARFPQPAQLSALGSPNPHWLCLLRLRKWGTPGLTDCSPGRWPLLEGHRDRVGREAHRCLQVWATANGGP